MRLLVAAILSVFIIAQPAFAAKDTESWLPLLLGSGCTKTISITIPQAGGVVEFDHPFYDYHFKFTFPANVVSTDTPAQITFYNSIGCLSEYFAQGQFSKYQFAAPITIEGVNVLFNSNVLYEISTSGTWPPTTAVFYRLAEGQNTLYQQINITCDPVNGAITGYISSSLASTPFQNHTGIYIVGGLGNC